MGVSVYSCISFRLPFVLKTQTSILRHDELRRDMKSCEAAARAKPNTVVEIDFAETPPVKVPHVSHSQLQTIADCGRDTLSDDPLRTSTDRKCREAGTMDNQTALTRTHSEGYRMVPQAARRTWVWPVGDYPQGFRPPHRSLRHSRCRPAVRRSAPAVQSGGFSDRASLGTGRGSSHLQAPLPAAADERASPWRKGPRVQPRSMSGSCIVSEATLRHGWERLRDPWA